MIWIGVLASLLRSCPFAKGRSGYEGERRDREREEKKRKRGRGWKMP